MNIWKKQAYVMALLDEEFLATLLEQHEREVYARIISLDIDELPIESIEGKVTGGSINVDGASALRRSCSLTMIAEDVNFHDYYWGICTKFKLEIGIANKLSGEYDPDNGVYPDIVWFPEGTFIISAFNTSLSVNSYTISVTGKDKMCMLNGDFGGQLFASIDFGAEEYKNKVFTKVDTSGIASSVGLMERQYYLKIDDASTIPEEILDTDDNYGFSQVGEKISYANASSSEYANKYYKKNNVFKRISDTSRYYAAVYEPYKLIKKPGEIFTPATITQAQEQTWTTGIYYCAKDGSLNQNEVTYFVLDNAKKYQTGKNYYQLADIYEMDYEYTIKKIPLEKIIRESVHTYAKEPYSNIVINDLDDYGLEQLTYKGEDPLIALRDSATQHFTNLVFANKFNNSNCNGFSISVVNNEISFNGISPDSLTSETTGGSGTPIYLKEQIFYKDEPNAPYKTYTMAPITFGQDLGYRVTDLTYPGDLISNIGDTLTSVLDKIKTMLGDFEYFYNLEGQFVFQRKKTFVNTAWSQFVKSEDESYTTYANDKKKFSFNFEGNRLISAVQNTPVLNNLKNDYVVWGKRTSVSGQAIPIHARYAIDKKPTEYMNFDGVLYYTEDALLHPTDQLLEQLGSSAGDGSPYSGKNTSIIPQCLIDADPFVANISNPAQKRARTLWYELIDWSNYYYSITGAYPQQAMKEYQKDQGFTGTITFPGVETRNLSGQLIIDFIQQTADGTITNNVDEFIPYYSASPFQHKYNNCSHTYSDFLNRYDHFPRMISYIYNPTMPSAEIIAADGGSIGVSSVRLVDWRELIYQMALDYFAGQGCSKTTPIYTPLGELVIDDPDHFLSAVAERNREKYPSGHTGYEQYYTDMQGFWRQLYNPDYLPKAVYDLGHYVDQISKMGDSQFFIKTKSWEEEKITDIEFEYYVLDESPGQQAYQSILTHEGNTAEVRSKIEAKAKIVSGNSIDSKKAWWNATVFENPESLNFWIEFLDDGDELSQFSVQQLGDRQKVVNDDKVTAVIFRDIPDLILYDRFDENGYPDTSDLRLKLQENTGYTWIYLPKGFSQYLTVSYRNISAKNKIDDLLYQHSYCIENISITALPIYHLEPNTRIYVCDKNTNVIGEYIVNKITLPLTYNGTMSITATLAPERLY